MYTKNEVIELKNRIAQLEKENKNLHETQELISATNSLQRKNQ
ncbi:hypothetical protein ACSVC9_00775 [Clostridium sp. LBM24168]